MTLDIRMLLFDMDGTLIRYPRSKFNSSWDALGKAAGLEKEFEENFQKYYRHRDKWNLWAEADASLLERRDFEEIKRKTLEIVSYAPGMEEFFESLDRKRYQTGILSQGVGFIAQEICRKFGLDFYLADELEVKYGQFTGKVTEGMKNRDKVEGLKTVCSRYYPIKPENICHVGDHTNDNGVFGIVKVPVFMDNGNKDPELEKARTAAKGNIIDNLKNLYQYIA